VNIGMVCYPTYGGSGVLATELGTHLARRGHHVHFITYAQPMRLDNYQENIYYHEVESPQYPLFEFNLYTLSLAGKIIDVAKYESLDVVHVHYAIPHAVSGFLASLILKDKYPFKLLTTLHGTDITLVGLDPSYHPLIQFALEKSDGITAVSNFLAERTTQNFGADLSIQIIPNFVDTQVYKPDSCTDLSRQIKRDSQFVLMHVSNFRSVKRVQDCVRVLALLLATVNVRLVLVGDGPERSEVERLSRELGVADHVTFLGKQSALPQLLSTADIFLLPSQQESFGLSALEAMACGVPVVATNIGGIGEVVKHGECGYLAELGDVQRMAKYCLDLLTSKRKMQAFKTAARERAVRNFDSSTIVPMYEAMYDALTQGK